MARAAKTTLKHRRGQCGLGVCRVLSVTREEFDAQQAIVENPAM